MLIERDVELAALDRTVRAAIAGSGRALLVEGPAGIGKTALLDAAASQAGTGMTVLRARSAAAEQAYAHGVVRQLLAAPTAKYLPLTGAAAMAAAALGHVDASDRRVDAFAAQHGLYWVCAELAESRPLLLLVDDAQWADAPSLAWLAHLVRRLEALPVSVIVSWRAGAPSPVAALRDELAQASLVDRLEPAPLRETGVAALIERTAGTPPDEEFARTCSELTGGNPFYVVEVVRALGRAPTAHAARTLDRAAPRVVAEEIERRLAAVGPEARVLADAIAVLDADAEVRHVAQLAGLDMEAALEAIDDLAAALLVDPGAAPRFAHPILRQVVYEQIAVGRRALLHRRAADLLEPDRAVGHLLRCPPAGDEAVVVALLGAAERAVARGAVSSARTLLDRAIREPPAEHRAQVLLALGRAGRLLGDRSALGDLREAQRVATTIDAQEEALLEQALLIGLDDRPADALALLDRAIAARPVEDEAAIRRLLAVRGAYTLTHDDLAVHAGDLGRHVADVPPSRELAPGDAGLLAIAAAQSALDMRHSAAQAVAWARRAIESGGLEPSGEHDLLYGWATRALVWADQGSDAAGLVARNVERAVTRGWRDGQAIAHAWSAFIAFWEGRLVDARLDAHAALEIGVAGAFARDFVSAIAVFVELDATGWEQAQALVRDAAEPSATTTGLLLRCARCAVAIAAGSGGDAETEADAILAAARRRGGVWLGPRVLAASAYRLAGRSDEARELVTAELDAAHRWGAGSHVGVALRELAMLDEDPGLLEESLTHLERSPRRVELARSLLAVGSSLRRAGERVAARERLRTALDLAVALGARPLADDATDELRSSGARLQRVRLSGVESLTPSEHRVARLAAAGLSNPEIAQRLYVTRATVETHLTHVYRKLDIASREHLANIVIAQLMP